MPLYIVPSTAVYRSASDGDTRQFTAGAVVDMNDAVKFGMAGATSTVAVSGGANQQRQTRAITASVDGTGNAVIPDGVDSVSVTSANSAHFVVLPNAAPGTVIRIRNGATGYNLQTHAPATHAINGGTGAAAKSAIPANTLVFFFNDTATTEIYTNTSTAGAVTATAVAT